MNNTQRERIADEIDALRHAKRLLYYLCGPDPVSNIGGLREALIEVLSGRPLICTRKLDEWLTEIERGERTSSCSTVDRYTRLSRFLHEIGSPDIVNLDIGRECEEQMIELLLEGEGCAEESGDA